MVQPKPCDSKLSLDRGLVAERSLCGVYVQAQCLDPEAGSGVGQRAVLSGTTPEVLLAGKNLELPPWVAPACRRLIGCPAP